MHKEELGITDFELPILTLSGPSGVGKDSLAKALIDSTGYLMEVVSTTTRAPRSSEIDGKDYYFVSKSEFESRIRDGEFLEWEEVYQDLYYGTEKSSLLSLQDRCQMAIIVIDYAGALSLKKIFGHQLTTVFITPPSIEALEQRLRLRKADDEQRILERVGKAELELQFAAKFDVVVVNDDFEICQLQLLKLVKNILRGD